MRMGMSARLDAVFRAKQAYVMARATLEHRLRDQLTQELGNLKAQVDMAVRFAYEAGETKANILRSLGTKDYNTVTESLLRTNAVVIVEGENPLDRVYEFDAEALTLSVTYVNHGPNSITNVAFFDVKKMDDGTTWFMSRNPLWNDTYTVRNEAVAALDGEGALGAARATL
jgi:hypothetical protein